MLSAHVRDLLQELEKNDGAEEEKSDDEKPKTKKKEEEDLEEELEEEEVEEVRMSSWSFELFLPR